MGFLQTFVSRFNKKELMNKFLIVGIGNIGDKYTKTRHNIGFLIIDKVSEILKSPFSLVKLGYRAEGVYKGKKIILPQNYYPDDDPQNNPKNRWRSHAHLLYGNWINEIYQTTPYDLNKIGR